MNNPQKQIADTRASTPQDAIVNSVMKISLETQNSHPISKKSHSSAHQAINANQLNHQTVWCNIEQTHFNANIGVKK